MKSAKVTEVNLERGYPTVDEALRDMISRLMTCKRQGCKAAVLVHGYGSSGTGGKIKKAVKAKLNEPSLTGMVRKSCGGEDWLNCRKEMYDICPQLRDFENRISGNSGITVVIFK